MKKTLLTMLALAPIGLIAQTTILSDNFDAYAFPGTVVGSAGTLWDTWSGGAGSAEDASLNNTIFSSASNSMFVKNGGPSAYENDMILAFPSTYTTGSYLFNLKIYIEQGFGGYFNLGGNWSSGGGAYDYGGDFFFNVDGTGNVDAPDSLAFTYNQGDWNDVSVLVNLDAGTKTLTVNGTIVGTNAWATAVGFGAADIFAVAYSTSSLTTEGTSEFYVDDVELINMTGVGIDENNLDANVSVYPSPNNGQFTVELKDAASSNYTVIISDLTGKVVETSVMYGNTADFNLNVTAGIYLVNISNGSQTAVKRISVQ